MDINILDSVLILFRCTKTSNDIYCLMKQVCHLNFTFFKEQKQIKHNFILSRNENQIMQVLLYNLSMVTFMLIETRQTKISIPNMKQIFLSYEGTSVHGVKM